jgi:hypothetical protein
MRQEVLDKRLETAVYNAIRTKVPFVHAPDWVQTVCAAIVDVVDDAGQSLICIPGGHMVESARLVKSLGMSKIVRWYSRLVK